jgi:hypothetical protein
MMKLEKLRMENRKKQQKTKNQKNQKGNDSVDDGNERTGTNGEFIDREGFDRKMEGVTADGIEETEGKVIYLVINDLLYATFPGEQHLRLCVPENLTDDVISLVHSTNHFGQKKSLSAIKTRFHFPRMSKVVDYIDACQICQTSKHATTKTAGLLRLIKTTPISTHTIIMDFITGLSLSDDGFNALLSITDKFTKCVKFIACKDTTTARETAELYIKHAYNTFGIPVKIISDRDPRFTSTFWRSLCNLLDISLNLTTAYHSAADGQSEKTNHAIETALRCIIGGEITKYSKWTSYLPIAHLRKYDRDTGEIRPLPIISETDQTEEWEVEKIRESSNGKGRKEYLIK